MILSLVQSPPTASLFPHNPKLRSLCPAKNPLFCTTSLPRFDSPNLTRSITNKHRSGTTTHASLVGDVFLMVEIIRASPAGQLLWNAAKIFGVLYLISLCPGIILSISYFKGMLSRVSDFIDSDPETMELLIRWNITIKGGIDRRYILKSPSEGQGALEVIESFFSEDEHFKDCRIWWGEDFFGQDYICCDNVTATLGESDIHIEIAPPPLGKGSGFSVLKSLFIKAAKLERVLRSSFAPSDQELGMSGFNIRMLDSFKKNM